MSMRIGLPHQLRDWATRPGARQAAEALLGVLAGMGAARGEGSGRGEEWRG
jgi:hypothetical protein